MTPPRTSLHRITTCAAFALTALIGAGARSAEAASLLSEWNLIVTDNLNTNSHVQGKTLVGDNLVANGAVFAQGLNPRSAYATTATLVVGGSVSGNGLAVEAGDFTHGGPRTTGYLNMNGGPGAQELTAAFDEATVESALLAESLAYLALAANSTISLPGAQPGPARLSAGANVSQAVFHIADGNLLLSNDRVQQIELVAGSATTVVVNVGGTTIDFDRGNMTGILNDAYWRSHIVWNFYEATTIRLDRSWSGAILAPLAHLRNSTNIDGAVAVRSFEMRGEVHLPLSLVEPPPTVPDVPEPASIALAGLGALGCAARRRAAPR